MGRAELRFEYNQVSLGRHILHLLNMQGKQSPEGARGRAREPPLKAVQIRTEGVALVGKGVACMHTSTNAHNGQANFQHTISRRLPRASKGKCRYKVGLRVQLAYFSCKVNSGISEGNLC